jgi:hypothetical protein
MAARLLLSNREEIVLWACRCLAALVKDSADVCNCSACCRLFGILFFTLAQGRAAAVSLVVPRLLALSDIHEEARAALRILYAASPAAIAARDVFQSINALIRQQPSVMFAHSSTVEAELSVFSQLRSIICNRRSSHRELENFSGAVACNSFIVLGGSRLLIACLKSNLCSNKVLKPLAFSNSV